ARLAPPPAPAPFPYTPLFRPLSERARREHRRAAADDCAAARVGPGARGPGGGVAVDHAHILELRAQLLGDDLGQRRLVTLAVARSEEHTSELQSRVDIVCRLL